jgi:hypothetical protein
MDDDGEEYFHRLFRPEETLPETDCGDVEQFLPVSSVVQRTSEDSQEQIALLQAAYPTAKLEVLTELVAECLTPVMDFILKRRTPREKGVLAIYLRQGFITKQDCTDAGFDVVVTRDLTKHGLVFGDQGGRIYLDFGLSNERLASSTGGFQTLPARKRDEFLRESHLTCALCRCQFEKKRLCGDHRVPHRVAGNRLTEQEGMLAYQVLCYTCNNRKQKACAACPNQQTKRDIEMCRSCFWAYPDTYTHVAGQPERRLEIVLQGLEADVLLTRLQESARANGRTLSKEVIERLSLLLSTS